MHTYYGSWIVILLCMVISGYASSKVRNTFAKYDRVPCRSRMTGHDTALRLLRASGISDISVGKVSGELSDHYHPARRIVNLSESTSNSASVAAVAVAAHEIGHVLQNKQHYLPYKIRTAIVPAVNLGSRLAIPLVLIGALLNTGIIAAGNSDLGYTLAMTGVFLYGFSVVFALVTLPVELNASRRARELLLSQGILSESEIPGAKAVLSAAAMTYLASLLVSVVYYLRFIFMVMTMFGRRNNRR